MRLNLLPSVFVLAGLLAGCGGPQPASVNDGACRVFQRAAVETCGLTQADQDAIDENTERGIAACRWQRPEARVPSCQELRDEIEQLRRSIPPVVPPPKITKSVWQRLLGGG